MGKKDKKEPMSTKKKAGIFIGALLGILLLVYAGGAVYFTIHFYSNTQIDGMSVGGKSLAGAEELLEDKVADYELEIIDKDGNIEKISGADVELKYKRAGELRAALEEQKVLLWPLSFFWKEPMNISVELQCDEGRVQQKVAELRVATQEQTPAQSAYPKFNGEKFIVEAEVYGTAIDVNILTEKTIEAFHKMRENLDMSLEKCYALPKYTAESGEVTQACGEMNLYCKARVTYTMDKDVVVDQTVISTWLTADENMKVILQEEAVRAWLEEFGNQYDTVGTERTFTTPTGKQATVSGGTYGWSINEEEECKVLLDAVQNQKTLTREPEYYVGGTAHSHGMPDWGTTYVEVDMTEQHLWYIVDGAVALETDVITGVPGGNRETPQGVNIIWEKEIGKTLVGEKDPATGKPEYESPVTYWMRVTWEGIGLHDATWQWNGFGGTLYQDWNFGSHGCVNMPYDQAEALYNMVEVGTPVVIHY